MEAERREEERFRRDNIKCRYNMICGYGDLCKKVSEDRMENGEKMLTRGLQLVNVSSHSLIKRRRESSRYVS